MIHHMQRAIFMATCATWLSAFALEGRSACVFPGKPIAMEIDDVAVEVVVTPDRRGHLSVFLCRNVELFKRIFEVEMARSSLPERISVGDLPDVELRVRSSDIALGSRRLGVCFRDSCQLTLNQEGSPEAPIWRLVATTAEEDIFLGDFTLFGAPLLHRVY